ncbi:MAG TPA: methyltransferase domain-containing protein [Candidatus Angelobacter sp.]
MRDLRGTDDHKLCALDLGPTSPANITFLTDRHMRVYNVDILRGAKDPGIFSRQDDGSVHLDVAKFFAENLSYPDGHFDAILCWDAADYLPEELVKPVVERLHLLLKPQGRILAFFHSKEVGPNSSYCHYHIVQPDGLEVEEGPGLRLQRVFNNRHIENLFKDFASRKFFLGRDNIREVMIVR